MKKSLVVFVVLVLALSAVSVTSNINIKQGIDVEVTTEKFKPLIWMCDHRVVCDDNVEPGRITGDCKDGKCEELVERIGDYAFEGEQIHWKVLVMDKNGIEKIKDVFITVGEDETSGNPIEAECKLSSVLYGGEEVDTSCNATIGEEDVDEATENTMAYYDCTFTVETPDSMKGEYWVTVEVEDLDGLSSIMDENEFWFFNPDIALAIDGKLAFNDVMPGSRAESETLLVGNDAEAGSGVLLDMFVSGTDFYDSGSSGALCPTSNQLALTNFAYYATNGAYSSDTDPRKGTENYVGICYGNTFDTSMYDRCEIIQGPVNAEGYYAGNLLLSGAEIEMTFRLDLPEPCNGDFDTGQIFFWGEAI